MTPEALFLESQTAVFLRANRIEIDEDILTESAESDPDWGTAWPKDRLADLEPEELEAFDFDEVKDELGVVSGPV